MAKLILMILDGWGISKNRTKNAIIQASTPNMDHLWKNNPHTALKASGKYVGLPPNIQGNSEVGHITIGAGRIVPQMLTRINDSIKDKSFFNNKQFLDAINHCKKHNTALHLMGLIQDQGVHAQSEHAIALLDLCRKEKFQDIHFHCFTDGRDTHPKSAKKFIKQIQSKLNGTSGVISTVSGRFYAMDRDTRWTRTKKAYDAIVLGKGRNCRTPLSALNTAYRKGETDEFITPSIIDKYEGMKRNDAVIFFNFRYDRARQLTQALTEQILSGFYRQQHPKIHMVAMSQYYDSIKANVAFPELQLKNILAEVLDKKKKRQLRVAETEKYAHVTYFFNGQDETPFKYEDRILIQSTRKVKTYDKAPEMSADQITAIVKHAIQEQKYDVIVMNFANADMVGHTGDFDAAKKAVETIDRCIGDIVHTATGTVVITADHGNAECMYGNQQTSHTTNEVPLIVTNNDIRLRKGGTLADVAPTVLALLHIPKPAAMTGNSLLTRRK